MDIWRETKHGVTHYKIVGNYDDVQEQIDLTFKLFPYEEYQTYVSKDEMQGDSRIVEIEHNQYKCRC